MLLIYKIGACPIDHSILPPISNHSRCFPQNVHRYLAGALSAVIFPVDLLCGMYRLLGWLSMDRILSSTSLIIVQNTTDTVAEMMDGGEKNVPTEEAEEP